MFTFCVLQDALQAMVGLQLMHPSTVPLCQVKQFSASRIYSLHNTCRHQTTATCTVSIGMSQRNPADSMFIKHRNGTELQVAVMHLSCHYSLHMQTYRSRRQLKRPCLALKFSAQPKPQAASICPKPQYKSTHSSSSTPGPMPLCTTAAQGIMCSQSMTHPGSGPQMMMTPNQQLTKPN